MKFTHKTNYKVLKIVMLVRTKTQSIYYEPLTIGFSIEPSIIDWLKVTKMVTGCSRNHAKTNLKFHILDLRVCELRECCELLRYVWNTKTIFLQFKRKRWVQARILKQVSKIWLPQHSLLLFKCKDVFWSNKGKKIDQNQHLKI